MLIKKTSWKRLFTSEFLSALRKKWFNSYKFSTNTFILNIRYRYPRSKYKICFYFFNDQLNYVLAYYFAELKTTKNNINKFLTNLLIVFFTKNLSYKNADK